VVGADVTPRLLCVILLAAIACTSNSRIGRKAVDRRVIVLGVDGLDYELVRDLMGQGRMPNFVALAESGGFRALTTTIPPQSPVAWSTFITGLEPGQHGIFDFIHRDAATLEPFLSTSRVESGRWILPIGPWRFPLSPGRVELLRAGEPFWQTLERRGISTTIVRMPANFPPSGSATRELSGMGTPDLLGTYGTASFYTSNAAALASADFSGGTLTPVQVVNGSVTSQILGPDNPYLATSEKTSMPFTVYIDETRQFAKIVVGGEERLLRVGEWSDWIPVALPASWFKSLRGECRFYLKRLNPSFELYVSPINLDPFDPELPISTPASYAADLARESGRYYTQGMPEDTKSLQNGVLSPDEFLQQARIAGDENVRQFRTVLNKFADGLLFYYFGNVDQVSHMMWRARDSSHPGYTPSDARYAMVVEDLYVDIDRLVGETLSRLKPDDQLIVMSDHGFTSWRRTFSVNSWLRDHGYLAVRNTHLANDPGLFVNVDWSHTRAYGLGLNGLYVNVRGREAHGIVDPHDRDSVAAQIGRELVAMVDPATGGHPVLRVFDQRALQTRPVYQNVAPDLVIGYDKGTRASDESALGAVPADVLTDNRGAWSGDHCMDPNVVRGILLSRHPLAKTPASLQALGGAVVAEFGIDHVSEVKEQ
jgi:predicted AlkP superfamily phosphohydrolase/phosphomutase